MLLRSTGHATYQFELVIIGNRQTLGILRRKTSCGLA